MALVFLLMQFSVLSARQHMGDSIFSKGAYHISVSFHHGYLIPHHRQMTYYIQDYINGFDVVFSRDLTHINPGRSPEAGGGYYFSNLGNKDIYGRTHGLYAYIGENYSLWNIPVEFHPSAAFGICYVTEQFDIIDNYKNRNIGSYLNAFVILSLKARIALSDDITLFGGPAMVHMSNGNIKMPNLGINLLTSRLGLTYNFNSDKLSRIGRELIPPMVQNPRLSGKDRISAILSGGIRQVSRKIPDKYVVGSLVLDYSREVFRNINIGAGIDLVKDPVEGLATYVSEEIIEDYDPWHMGAHLTIERTWNRFSVVGQPGYKIFTRSEHKSYQFNRAGIRYRLDNGITFSASIKSHGVKADFFEWGLGYVFM